MPNVPSIDNFKKSFPTIYGIDSGFCYDVKQDFRVESLIEYEEKGYLSGIKYYEPVWVKINLLKGDSIMSSKNGIYASLKEFEGLIEIRPVKEIGEQKPSFDFIKEEYLKKIGRDNINLKMMPLEERKKIIYARGI